MRLFFLSTKGGGLVGSNAVKKSGIILWLERGRQARQKKGGGGRCMYIFFFSIVVLFFVVRLLFF